MQFLLNFVLILVIGQSLAVLNNDLEDLLASPAGYNEPSRQYLPTDNNQITTQAQASAYQSNLAQQNVISSGIQGSYQSQQISQQYQPSIQNQGISQIEQTNQNSNQAYGVAQQNGQGSNQYQGSVQPANPSNQYQISTPPAAVPGNANPSNQGAYQQGYEYPVPSQQNIPENLNVPRNQAQYENSIASNPQPNNQGTYQEGYANRIPSQQNVPVNVNNQGSYPYPGSNQQNRYQISNKPATTNPNNQGSYQYPGPNEKNVPANSNGQDSQQYQISNKPAPTNPNNQGSYQYLGSNQQNVPANSNGQDSQQYQISNKPIPDNPNNQGSYPYPGSNQQNVPANSNDQNSHQYQISNKPVPVNQTPNNQGPYFYPVPNQQNTPITSNNQGPPQYQTLVNPGPVNHNSNNQGSHPYPGSNQQYQTSVKPDQVSQTSNNQGTYPESNQQNIPAISNTQSSDQYQVSEKPVPINPAVMNQGTYAYSGSYQHNVPATPNPAPYNEESVQSVHSNHQHMGTPQENVPAYSVSTTQGSYPEQIPQYNMPAQINQGPSQSNSNKIQESPGPYQYQQNLPAGIAQNQQNIYPSLESPSQNLTPNNQKLEQSNASPQQPGSYDAKPLENNPRHPKQYQEPHHNIGPTQTSSATIANNEPNHLPIQSADVVQSQTSSLYTRPSQYYQAPDLESNQNITTNTHTQQYQSPAPQTNTQELQKPTTVSAPAPVYHGPSHQYLPATITKPNSTSSLPTNPTYNHQPWNPIKPNNNLQTTTANSQGPVVTMPQGYRYNTPAQSQPSTHAQTFNGVVYNELGMEVNTSTATTQKPASGKTEIETKRGYMYAKPQESTSNGNSNSNGVTHLIPVNTMPPSYIYYNPDGTRASSNNQTNGQQSQQQDSKPSADNAQTLDYSQTDAANISNITPQSGNSEHADNTKPSAPEFPTRESQTNPQQQPQNDASYYPGSASQSGKSESENNSRPSTPEFPTNYMNSAQHNEEHNAIQNRPFIPTESQNSGSNQKTNDGTSTNSGLYQNGATIVNQNQQYASQTSLPANQMGNQISQNQDYPLQNQNSIESQRDHLTNQNTLPSEANSQTPSQNPNYPLGSNQFNMQPQVQQNPIDVKNTNHGNPQISENVQMTQNLVPNQSSSQYQFPQYVAPQFQPNNYPSNGQGYPQNQQPQYNPQSSFSQEQELSLAMAQTQLNQANDAHFRPSPQYNIPSEQIVSQGTSNSLPGYQPQSLQVVVGTNYQAESSFGNKPPGYPTYSSSMTQQNPFLNSDPSSPLPQPGQIPSSPLAEQQRGDGLAQNQQSFLVTPTTGLEVTSTNAVGNFKDPSGSVPTGETNAVDNLSNLIPKPPNKIMTFEETKTYMQMPSHSFELPSYYTMVPAPAHHPSFMETPTPNGNNKVSGEEQPIAPIVVTEQTPIMMFEQSTMPNSQVQISQPMVFVETPMVSQEPVRMPHLVYGSPIPETSNMYLPPNPLMQPPYLKK